MKSVFFIIRGNISSNPNHVLVEIKEGRNHFIGGKFDKDETLTQAGVRESSEEIIGLDKVVIKSTLESWTKTGRNFNILNIEGIPEFEQHFAEIYADIENIKINPKGEVTSLKITTIEELLADPYYNTHAVNAWLSLNYTNKIARSKNSDKWNEYISMMRRGENPHNAKKIAILVTGASGSGKSTLLAKIKDEIGFSRTNRVLIDLDVIGFRNDDKEWIIPADVIKALKKSTKVLIAFGISSNFKEYALTFDKVIWLNDEITEEHEDNIRKREEERNKRQGHTKGEDISTKLKTLRMGLKNPVYKELNVLHKNLIALSSIDASNFLIEYLGNK